MTKKVGFFYNGGSYRSQAERVQRAEDTERVSGEQPVPAHTQFLSEQLICSILSVITKNQQELWVPCKQILMENFGLACSIRNPAAEPRCKGAGPDQQHV